MQHQRSHGSVVHHFEFAVRYLLQMTIGIVIHAWLEIIPVVPRGPRTLIEVL